MIRDQFLMLYYMQEVAIHFRKRDTWRYRVNNPSDINHIVLKPITRMTALQAQEVCRIVFGRTFITVIMEDTQVRLSCTTEPISVRINLVGNYMEVSQGDLEYEMPFPAGAVDYLRSLSYAMPYMQLTVDELIKLGYMKLDTIL